MKTKIIRVSRSVIRSGLSYILESPVIIIAAISRGKQ